MTLSPDDKKALSDIRFEKACEFLEDGRANFKESRLKTAVNRSYYAAFNAARSLLILEGINPETHSGTITTISLRFVKTGLLPVEIVKNFKLLLSRRTDVDYGDFESINAGETEDSLKKAEYIVKQIDMVRKKLKSDMSNVSES